ncbi:MAG: PilZ domain-containing protein [Nitrospirota bacterium]|nr:PilZ domain-containing protein [Nitrospirota bacterium]MDE3243642.1 PilZ domain-containing protein [Nitrospirota bacterium]
MHAFVSYRRNIDPWEQAAAHRGTRPQRDRRAYSRASVSFPLEFGVLPRFKHWLIRPTYQAIRSIERNPTGRLAVPDPEPWAYPYLAMARYLGKLLLINGARCWDGEGQVESANGLDLSQGGLRMATTYPLWTGAALHLRVPASAVAPFGYTVLGKVMRVAKTDRDEVEAGVAFTGIHPSDRYELVRFLMTPLPQLAALRRQARESSPPRADEPAPLDVH